MLNEGLWTFCLDQLQCIVCKYLIQCTTLRLLNVVLFLLDRVSTWHHLSEDLSGLQKKKNYFPASSCVLGVISILQLGNWDWEVAFYDHICSKPGISWVSGWTWMLPVCHHNIFYGCTKAKQINIHALCCATNTENLWPWHRSVFPNFFQPKAHLD